MASSTSRIVDAWGNPIDTGPLKEMQTAEVASVFRPFAGYPVQDLTPTRLNAILRDADAGHLGAAADLYEEMAERNGHMSAEMGKRCRAAATLDWSIQTPPDADKAEQDNAAFLADVLSGLSDFESILLDMTDAIGKGYACSEIEWAYEEGIWLPRTITLRPANWFMTRRDDRNTLRLVDATGMGEDLRPFSWVVHRHRAKSGDLSRTSLCRMLTWPFLFKTFAIRDLAEFLEIFGIPIRIGKYASNASEAEKRTLMRALVQMGHSGAGTMPDTMKVEFQEAAAGAATPFLDMNDLCERTESKLILGGTLTSQADGKSATHALGTIHNEVRLDLRNSDAKQLQGTLRRDLLYPILALNGRAPTNMRRTPSLVFDTQLPENLKLLAESLPLLVKSGLKIPERHVYERLRIPMPKDGEAVLQPLPGAVQDAQRAAEHDSAGNAATSTRSPHRAQCPVHEAALSGESQAAPPADALDALAAIAGRDAQAAMSLMLDPFFAQLDEDIDKGLTLAQFREKVAALATAMPVEGVAEPLANAAFNARLAGEADV